MEMETLSVSSALQIAGRAGRYGTQWDHVGAFSVFSVLLCSFEEFRTSALTTNAPVNVFVVFASPGICDNHEA